MPAAGFSIRSAARYMRRLLSLQVTTIGGELLYMADGDRLSLHLLVNGQRVAKLERDHYDGEIDRLFHDGARRVLEVIEPYILAYYYYDTDRSRVPVLLSLLLTDETNAKREVQAVALLANFVHDCGVAYNGHPDLLNRAIRLYKRTVALDPSYSSAYYNWGNALYALGDYAGAIGKYRHAIAHNPSPASLHYSRRSRISHRRGLLDRERSLSDMAAGAAGGVAWPSRHRAVAEARLGEGSAGTGGGARDRDVRRAPRGL